MSIVVSHLVITSLFCCEKSILIKRINGSMYVLADLFKITLSLILFLRSRSGRDHMVVGFTTTYAISVYHHWCCEFKSRSEQGVKHVINFVWLATGRWFSPGHPVSSSNKTHHTWYEWNIVESGIKHHPTIKQTCFS